MATTEVLRENGLKTTTITRFVATKAPQLVAPPAGEFWPSYYLPGNGYTETITSSVPFELGKITRISNKTAGFNSPNRPYLLRPLAFNYAKERNTATGNFSTWSVPSSGSDGPGSAGYDVRSIISTNSIIWGFASDPSAAWVIQLQQKATSNLLKNLRDSSFNAAQALAERQQTANLVASTATKVAKAISNLRKGNFPGAARDLGVLPKKRAGRRFNSEYIVDQAKATGNGWLELQYGWKPLLSDVYGAMETLAKSNSQGNPNTVFFRRSGRAKRKEEKTAITNQLSGSLVGFDNLIRSYTAECQVRTGVVFSKSSAPLASLASVGITNPALLAWELLPYSFVVDWFLPIGNYLESLDATNGLTFYSGYITTYRKFHAITSKEASFSTSSGYQQTQRWDREEQVKVWVTRTPLGSFPSLPFPSFKNPLSTSHVASAMALLLQLKR